MRVVEIIKLCQTNKAMAQLCNQEETWRFLLERDFPNIKESLNPKKEYFGQVLRKLAIKFNDIATDPRIGYRNDESAYLNHIIYYKNLALSALGIGDDGKKVNIFGNSVGTKLVEYLSNNLPFLHRFEGYDDPTMLDSLFFEFYNIKD